MVVGGGVDGGLELDDAALRVRVTRGREAEEFIKFLSGFGFGVVLVLRLLRLRLWWFELLLKLVPQGGDGRRANLEFVKLLEDLTFFVIGEQRRGRAGVRGEGLPFARPGGCGGGGSLGRGLGQNKCDFAVALVAPNAVFFPAAVAELPGWAVLDFRAALGLPR